MKSKVVFSSRDEAGRHQERAATTYPDWEEEDGDDEEFNPYGKCDATSHDQAGCLPFNRIVMQASPNKGATADLRQVDKLFEEFEPQLLEDVDFPWWPQVLPLTVGEDRVMDKNAKSWPGDLQCHGGRSSS